MSASLKHLKIRSGKLSNKIDLKVLRCNTCGIMTSVRVGGRCGYCQKKRDDYYNHGINSTPIQWLIYFWDDFYPLSWYNKDMPEV